MKTFSTGDIKPNSRVLVERRRSQNMLPPEPAPAGSKSEMVDTFTPSQKPTNVFMIDFNNNGRYEQGEDGVLALDMNGDGKYDAGDVNETSAVMRAASGNIDFNNDGMVDQSEQLRARVRQKSFRRIDRNGDGKLDQSELKQAGGRVWVDNDKDGKLGFGETSSPDRVEAGKFMREGNRTHAIWTRKEYQVHSVDPSTQSSVTGVAEKPIWPRPSYQSLPQNYSPPTSLINQLSPKPPNGNHLYPPNWTHPYPPGYKGG